MSAWRSIDERDKTSDATVKDENIVVVVGMAEVVVLDVDVVVDEVVVDELVVVTGTGFATRTTFENTVAWPRADAATRNSNHESRNPDGIGIESCDDDTEPRYLHEVTTSDRYDTSYDTPDTPH